MNPDPPFSEAPDPFSAEGPDGPQLQSGDPPDPGQSKANTGSLQSPAVTPASASEDRMWATLTHLSIFVGFLGPIVLWLIFRNSHPRVNLAGRAVLNFQISLLLWAGLGLLLAIVGIGILILWALGICFFIFPILAAVRTNEGRDYKYPLTIDFL